MPSFWESAKADVYRTVGSKPFVPPLGTVTSLYRGNRNEKIIALTIDDGPRPIFTERLIKELTDAKVPATFFVVGKVVEKRPELVKELDQAGFQIGNHSYHHPKLTKLDYRDVVAEYKATNDLITKITGKPVKYCRPPGGDANKLVIDAAASLGLKTVFWTDDPADFAKPTEKLLESKAVRRLTNGGIVLLHTGIQQTIDMLPTFIAEARKEGFRFVSLDDLAGSFKHLAAKKSGSPSRRA